MAFKQRSHKQKRSRLVDVLQQFGFLLEDRIKLAAYRIFNRHQLVLSAKGIERWARQRFHHPGL